MISAKNKKYRKTYLIKSRYRFFRRIRFRITRLILALFLRTWVREVIGIENIVLDSPAIFVSNHLSYCDFLIIGSLLRKYIVFVANKEINQTFFFGWFTKVNHVVYVDRDNPGFSFFKDILRHLEKGRSIVIYPEGTRSRTGKMFKPKEGFVKLAIKARVPIIPVAMKGTYEILPPHRFIPRLKRCSVIIGERIFISPENNIFKDIFLRRKNSGKSTNLTKEETKEIAFRIMDRIRVLANEDWDESALEEISRFQRRHKTS